jgi:hypothetical protein
MPVFPASAHIYKSMLKKNITLALKIVSPQFIMLLLSLLTNHSNIKPLLQYNNYLKYKSL